MRLKYVARPDFCGGHFISSIKLVELFGVRKKEVLFPDKDKVLFPDKDNHEDAWRYYAGITIEQFKNLIPLRPQKDGDYSLERAKTQFVRHLFTGSST